MEYGSSAQILAGVHTKTQSWYRKVKLYRALVCMVLRIRKIKSVIYMVYTTTNSLE
jgi:hypothetical protein